MLDQYREVVLVDFEFIPRDGERLEHVVCAVAHLLKSGTTLRVWQDQFGPVPPYPTGPDVLFVAYNAVAEVSCHLALGWPAPARVLDLYVENLARINSFREPGTEPPEAKLITALAAFGLDSIGATEKRDMIELIIRGGPWTAEEREAILDYCQSDVEALRRLLPAMLPTIDLPRAELRGRYMCAVAAIERNGIPIDVGSLDRLRQHLPAVKARLVAEDDPFGVYTPDGSFVTSAFVDLINRLDLPWPTRADGTPNLDKETFRDMANTPGVAQIAPIVQLRNVFSGPATRHRPHCRQRQPQSHRPIPVPLDDGTQPAVECEIHLRLRALDARPDQAAAEICDGVPRLEAAGVRHRRGAVRRYQYDHGIPVRRSISRVRQVGRCRACGRDQRIARRTAGPLQDRRARRAVRSGGPIAGGAH
jgi:hypothetical protein